MKSYKEMTKCVLAARDEYVRKKKRRKAIIMRTAPILLSACFICVFGVRLWGDLRDLPKAPEEIINPEPPVTATAASTATSPAVTDNAESPEKTTAQPVITIAYETKTEAVSITSPVQTAVTREHTSPPLRTSSPSAAQRTSSRTTVTTAQAMTTATEHHTTAETAKPPVTSVRTTAPTVQTTKPVSTTVMARPTTAPAAITTIKLTTVTAPAVTTRQTDDQFGGGCGNPAPGGADPGVPPGGGNQGGGSTGSPSGGGTGTGDPNDPDYWWNMMTPPYKFPTAQLDGLTYTANGCYISGEDIGNKLRQAQLSAQKDEDTVVYTPSVVYEIKNVAADEAVAIKFPDNDRYYIYFTDIAAQWEILERLNVLGEEYFMF